MKRDWDCIRAILVALEEKGDAESKIRSNAIEGFDAANAAYNMKLLIQANLIEGGDFKPGLSIAKGMTWEGHELLDKMRSEQLWNRIKTMAREKGVSLSLEAVKFLGTHALSHVFASAGTD
jgi:hypothetical protein